jgi:hypothetical protein
MSPPAHHPAPAGTAPPTSSKVTGSLALIACAACCALPVLIGAGVVTATGAAILKDALVAVAAGLAVLALGTWWLHHRRAARRLATAGGSGCDCGNC